MTYNPLGFDDRSFDTIEDREENFDRSFQGVNSIINSKFTSFDEMEVVSINQGLFGDNLSNKGGHYA